MRPQARNEAIRDQEVGRCLLLHSPGLRSNHNQNLEGIMIEFIYDLFVFGMLLYLIWVIDDIKK